MVKDIFHGCNFTESQKIVVNELALNEFEKSVSERRTVEDFIFYVIKNF